jgi:hypothetical protein
MPGHKEELVQRIQVREAPTRFHSKEVARVSEESNGKQEKPR